MFFLIKWFSRIFLFDYQLQNIIKRTKSDTLNNNNKIITYFSILLKRKSVVWYGLNMFTELDCVENKTIVIRHMFLNKKQRQERWYLPIYRNANYSWSVFNLY